jgi:murein DD-endopeptidase MepM/ murein hydrolase activator NlpD
VHETALERRETLEGALLRSGVGRVEAREMVAVLRGAVNMRRLRPGERLLVTRAPGGAVEAVAYVPSALERHELRRDGDGWRVATERTPVETRVVALAGRLEDSLFASIERLGESAPLSAAFVRLFEWDVDFAADSLPGDRFRLLVEKRYAGGELIGYGDILVAQYETAGRPVLTGVAFGDDDGQRQHFDGDGRSVKKMFLRAPLDFTRITSGFSHARRHPILGGLRPHLAIDYGAPTGTPVRAVADGTVAAAGWSGGNGISVILRHARGYQTMYNHLSAAAVRPGQRVRQRDVIGRVGATGLATGSHLDYRVSRNGQFVNPLGEKFIPGAPVPPERRRAFRSHLAGLLERLDREAPLPPRDAGS